MMWKNLSAAACLAALCACAVPPTPAPAPNLKRVWMLDEWPGFSRETLHQAQASLNLTGLPHASAYMGCNRIMLRVEPAGDAQAEGAVAISAVASTLKMCIGNMALEQDFGRRIGSFKHYRLEGHRLILEDGKGAAARFVAQDWD